MTMQLPYLTDDELGQICAPLTNGAAQVRYLERLGMKVQRKPNGRPLVARGEFERVMVGGRAANDAPAQNAGPSQPNRAALVQLFNKGGRGGAQTQGR